MKSAINVQAVLCLALRTVTAFAERENKMFATIEDYQTLTEDMPPGNHSIIQDGRHRRGVMIRWLDANPITSWHGGTFIEQNGVEWKILYRDGIGWQMWPIDNSLREQLIQRMKTDN